MALKTSTSMLGWVRVRFTDVDDARVTAETLNVLRRALNCECDIAQRHDSVPNWINHLATHAAPEPEGRRTP